MKLTMPNIISWARILIVPFFFYLMISETDSSVGYACLLYFIASTSDYLDGWVARRYGEVSNFGKFLDPLADKILTTAAFAVFAIMNIVEVWMVLIIVIRDFGTTVLRIYSDKSGREFKTSNAAKLKTTLQMFFIAIILLLLLLKESVTFSKKVLGITPENLDTVLYSDIIYYSMFLIVVLSVWTGIEYLFQLGKIKVIKPQNYD